MKKIIIIIIIILLIISVVIILSGFEKYSGLIISKENNIVIIQSPSPTTYENITNNIDEEIECKYYSFSIEDVLIKNCNGHKVEISELEIGDTINVFKIKEKLKKDISYDTEPLKNIKMIKIIKKN